MQAFEATNFYFDQAAALLDLTDNMRTLMITPDRELRVEVTIEMDSGQIGNFIGYRVQHDNARGPFKGGLRYHPHVDQDEARVAGQPDDLEDGRRRHPLRRGQGGDELRPEQALARRAGAADPQVRPADPRLHRPRQGHPRPRRRHRRAGHGLDHERVLPSSTASSPACVTGKPVEFHGSAGREAATGYGVAIVAREMLARLEPDGRRDDLRHPGLRQRRQPHGPVPPRSMGGKIVAVSDAYGARLQPRGARRRRARRATSPLHRKVVGFKGGDADHERAAPDDARRRPDPRGPGRRLRRRDGRGRPGRGHRRGRQRPDLARGRRGLPRPRASWSSPTSWPTPAASSSATSSGSRTSSTSAGPSSRSAARRRSGSSTPSPRSTTSPSARTSRCAPPPSCWPSPASAAPGSSAESEAPAIGVTVRRRSSSGIHDHDD